MGLLSQAIALALLVPNMVIRRRQVVGDLHPDHPILLKMDLFTLLPWIIRRITLPKESSRPVLLVLDLHRALVALVS
jgi:hypothetical protein